MDNITSPVEIVENFCTDCGEESRWIASIFVDKDRCPHCEPDYYRFENGIFIRKTEK
jgi:hypothetical protein